VKVSSKDLPKLKTKKRLKTFKIFTFQQGDDAAWLSSIFGQKLEGRMGPLKSGI
jgi:hypothetical protein